MAWCYLNKSNYFLVDFANARGGRFSCLFFTILETKINDRESFLKNSLIKTEALWWITLRVFSSDVCKSDLTPIKSLNLRLESGLASIFFSILNLRQENRLKLVREIFQVKFFLLLRGDTMTVEAWRHH